MPTKDPEVRRRNSRDYYLRNREAVKAKSRERKREAQGRVWDLIASHLAENPCVDCGETDPLVLEFDHRDPAGKSFTIGTVDTVRSLESVSSEIAKCDVRCANCHRRRTSQQYNSWRWKRWGTTEAA